uniref:Uncharacterized protein n=1 Tax=Anopheles culicifacies TaxID=139723 RepID=A0A182MIN7_9DIPT
METIGDLPKIDTTQNLDNFVSRQQYDQLLDDYNKLKERNESKASEQEQDVLEAYIDRINRFEHLMKELQQDFLQMKASVRSRALVNNSARTIEQRSRGDDSSAINYVMTIVHPKRSMN